MHSQAVPHGHGHGANLHAEAMAAEAVAVTEGVGAQPFASCLALLPQLAPFRLAGQELLHVVAVQGGQAPRTIPQLLSGGAPPLGILCSMLTPASVASSHPQADSSF
jgi:hypothetical protein